MNNVVRPSRSTLLDPRFDRSALIFYALCSRARFTIVALLIARGPLTNRELAGLLGITANGLGAHLKVLRESALIVPETKGLGRARTLTHRAEPGRAVAALEFALSVLRPGPMSSTESTA